jgi:hypothetical protein
MRKPEDYDDDWIEALVALDQGKDKKPLTDMLRSDCALSSNVREYLADLIERHCTPLPRGRPKTPAYTIGDKNIAHFIALKFVQAYRRAGMPLEDALEKAAKERSGLTVTALRLSYQGRHTSLRRSIKR